MLTVPGLAVRNLRHRRVRTMFLAALVLILSAALFTSRVLTESMKTCIDKTVDRIGADVIVAPREYESDLSDSLFSGGLCSFYFENSLIDQVKKTDGIDKISPQLYIASLDAACCSVPVQIVAFEPESDFIVQPWMSGSNVSELKKGQTVAGSKITAKAGDKISFFGQEYEVAGKLEETGTINLPLCLNPLDRPRQMVSEEYGKPAVTEYRILNYSDKYIRIAFYPLTGRTHQLRVHAAHHQGLNCPILGDELYGKKADRLYLHAEYIEFRHPVYGDIICIQKEAEF